MEVGVSVGVAVEVGVSVGVAVEVGVSVDVGVDVLVAVKVGAAVEEEVGVLVGVTVACGVPKRMEGTNQKTLALLGLLLTFTPRTNRTVCPSRKEISSLIREILPSYSSCLEARRSTFPLLRM